MKIHEIRRLLDAPSEHLSPESWQDVVRDCVARHDRQKLDLNFLRRKENDHLARIRYLEHERLALLHAMRSQPNRLVKLLRGVAA